MELFGYYCLNGIGWAVIVFLYLWAGAHYAEYKYRGKCDDLIAAVVLAVLSTIALALSIALFLKFYPTS